jgi:hypothetical protein
MKTFTIENETNNITAHPTAQEAESVLGAERFATAAAFTGLAAHWPSARLIEIWNSLPGATAITKFKDRKTAVTRIWNAIQSLGEPVATQGARKPHVAPVKAESPRNATPSKPKPKTAPKSNGTRQGTKAEEILYLLKRPDGASLKEIMKATGWQAHSVRGFISGTLRKKMSLTVVSTKTEGGERNYSIKA